MRFSFNPRNGNGNSNTNPPRIGKGGGDSLTNGQGIAPLGGGSGSNSMVARAMTNSNHQYARDGAKQISATSFAKNLILLLAIQILRRKLDNIKRPHETWGFFCMKEKFFIFFKK